MSAAPKWLDDMIGEFGRSIGIQSLSLGERGVAALAGDRGVDFRMEYVYPHLFVSMTVAVTKDEETAKSVLALAEPMRRGRFAIRCGFMPKSNKAFFAVRIAHDSVTVPVLMDAFRELSRLTGRFAGGAR